MTKMRLMAAAISLAALSACGTHRSVAPQAAGRLDPTEQSVSDARLQYLYEPSLTRSQERRAQRRQASRSAAVTPVEPANLHSVTAIYLDDDQREEARRSKSSSRSGTVQMVAVQQGDTVYAIARRYDVAPKDIIALNRLRAPYHLAIGQRLQLPGASSYPTAETTSRVPDAHYNLPSQVRKTEKPKPVRKQYAPYPVRAGDTLYSISRRTNTTVAQLAAANDLRPPYALSPGQKIIIPNGDTPLAQPARATSPQLASVTPSPAPARQNKVDDIARQVNFTEPRKGAGTFIWPVRGAVIADYGVGDLGRRNDGINIAAPAGTPVRASADGEVVYRGSELEGFGNLLLVKHADGFVTAYAHNDAMLVKKGDVVRRGQVIAKVGQSGNVKTPQLHFEIRQKLKSIDPRSMLERK